MIRYIMKKIVCIVWLVLNGLTSFAQRGLNSEERFILERRIFITDWIHFRMWVNPALSYEETHDQWGSWKNPFTLFNYDAFSDYYIADLKVHNWDSLQWRQQIRYGNPRNTYAHISIKGYYVIEKGNGLPGVWNEWRPLEEGVPDTFTLHVYDELFPYDNRFLVYYDPKNKNKAVYYSGNVNWDTNEKYGGMPIEYAALMRGVQFGVERVCRISDVKRDSLRKLLPNQPNYNYVTAEASFLNTGNLIIGGPEGKEHLLIELIYYTDDPKKTGDAEKVFYEMRYILPTKINSIKERRLEKRKLSDEETQLLQSSYLCEFIDKWRRWIIEEVIDE